ncbi:MAG: hypothetical protein QNJ31_04645 [Candidatus Caenarcaniphilales bacterium]|nr:hypothetical protein [Candidatus Caenarcaniphilales bacterium]
MSDPTLESELKDYWTHIKELTTGGQIADYSTSKGTSQGFIQLRTKGSGTSQSTCPITGKKFKRRAFYATKSFLTYVWGVMS